MRRKLLLTIGLAVLGACLVAGTVGAQTQDTVVGVGESGVQIDIPNGQNLDDLQAAPECSNTVDDDKDELTDLDDPDCSGELDTTESGTRGIPDPNQPPADDNGGGGGAQTGGGGGGAVGGPGQGHGGVSGPSGSGGRGTGSSDDEKPGDRKPHHGGGRDEGGSEVLEGDRKPADQPLRNSDGSPTNANPGLTIADFGPAPIGVPNFVIDQFSIPPFLLPIYQACGTQYGIPWQVLASINRIETAFGTNLNVSSAGALGWMQFMPSTWEMYGVDANEDGRKDPYNPVDAICAAARYLKAAGGESDLRRAIFAYNHADWYVDEVLLYARQYGNLPEDLIGSLTGLTEGAHFPVAANARYADDISERQALANSKPGKRSAGNAADVISGSPTRRGIDIFTHEGAPIVAVNDGVVTKTGESKKLGRYLVLRDAYGNRFTYAQLGAVAKAYPVPKQDELTSDDFKLVTPGDGDPQPTDPASAGSQADERKAKAAATKSEDESGPVDTEDSRARLFAYPERKNNAGRADLTGQLDELLAKKLPGFESFKSYMSGVLRYDAKTMQLKALREGSEVTAGTVLGRVGKTDGEAAHLHFTIQPAGRGAPKIDPKPILDGWKLLEATAIYRAAGKDPFEGSATTGQVLLMSKTQLIERVLADPALEIYSCGRQDIRAGLIDRRVLAMLEYLVARGYRLTITSLECGHSTLTTSGNVSEHSTGDAVDIAEIDGQPIYGHQGPGTLSEALVKDLLQLQGTMKPHQIISLMDYFGADNTYAMADHDDHVHVGYQPVYGSETGGVSNQFEQILKPQQWKSLIDRLGEIDNPSVPTSPSKYALPAGKDRKSGKRSSSAHVGE